MSNQPPEDPQVPPQGAPQDPAPNYGSPNYGSPNYGAPSYGEATGGTPAGYDGGASYPAGTPGAAPEQPASLANAVRLMYVGAALSLLSFVAVFFQMDAIRDTARESLENSGQEVTDSLVSGAVAVSIGIVVVFGLIGAGLWVLMAIMNGKGKKWARITATVLGGIGILFNLIGLTGAATALDLILSVIMIVLAAAILFLLWRPENKPYYEAMSAPRMPS